MKPIIKHTSSGTNSYMFRHQSAIFGEFIDNKGFFVLHALQLLVALISLIKIKILKILKF